MIISGLEIITIEEAERRRENGYLTRIALDAIPYCREYLSKELDPLDVVMLKSYANVFGADVIGIPAKSKSEKCGFYKKPDPASKESQARIA